MGLREDVTSEYRRSGEPILFRGSRYDVRPMTLAHSAPLVGAVVMLLMTGAGTALAGEAHRSAVRMTLIRHDGLYAAGPSKRRMMSARAKLGGECTYSDESADVGVSSRLTERAQRAHSARASPTSTARIERL